MYFSDTPTKFRDSTSYFTRHHSFKILFSLPFTIFLGGGGGDRGGKVAKVLCYKSEGLIPDGVNGIFHLHNPSDRTMALGSTQPLGGSLV
jgi:hypothetical protein